MDFNKKLEELRRQAEQSELLKTASESVKKVAAEARKRAGEAAESDTFKNATAKARSAAGQLGARLVQLSESVQDKPSNKQPTHHATTAHVTSSHSNAEEEASDVSPKASGLTKVTKTSQASHKTATIHSKPKQQIVGIAILVAMVVGGLLLVLIGGLLEPDDSSTPSTVTASQPSTKVDSPSENKKTESKTETEPKIPKVDTSAFKGSLAKTVADKLRPEGYEVKALEEGTGLDVTANIDNEDRWILDATQDGKTITLAVKQLPKTLTQDDPELAALLAVRDPLDPSVEQFAQKHAGDYIEFDGNIASISPESTTLVHAGNYDPNSVSGPEFQFLRVPLADSGPLSVGMNVHVRAKVGYFDSTQGLFKLDYDSITLR
ncbi:DUF4839 domain-containing protein [Bifidobacterium longum]|uniref:DUF4839 domain-containing protein n=1 Tax=Bifidobacterium longum TaxID=216816 RepID=UPI00351CD91B